MDEREKKQLEELRALGVKRVVFNDQDDIVEIEFFEQAPGIGRLDADTLVPPAPLDPDATQPHVPRAIANILKKGSVS